MSKDVEFQDLVYAVNERRNFGNDVRKRTLLKGVSGLFRHGQLTAIMGPSGAGKSSLLNAISGYRKSGVEGNLRINRKASCYITQEDHHQPLLTVEELMNVACKLKTKLETDQQQIITDVLTSLHLNHRRNITADRLSGGERKRLSIALELVANPSIFFLDEPTSGLDEVTASGCIRLLRDLAKQDRTVVCTIHQPSAAIFALFDHIYILAKGQCVYQGQPRALVPYLSYNHLDCPRHYNPADFIIELCDSENDDAGNLIASFSHNFSNGKSTCNVLQLPQDENSLQDPIGFIVKPMVASMILESQRPKVGTFVQKMKQISRLMKNQHAVSGFMQFCVLFRLMMLKTFRNTTVLWIQLIHHLVCGFFIGMIFINAANEGERMFDHLKFCLGVVFFSVYTQIMVPILNFPSEVKLVKKECFNRWYGLFPYYMAMTCSRIPLQVALNLMFSMLVYSLAGLPAELWRFGLFAMVGIIVSFVAEGFGLLVGATFNVTNGSAIGPMSIAPFLGLAIYGFDFAPDISWYMNAFMKLSFVRGGVVSVILVVFGMDREQLDCNDLYCHFGDPKVLLRYLRIEKFSLWTEVGILLTLMIFIRTLCYLSLRRRFNK